MTLTEADIPSVVDLTNTTELKLFDMQIDQDSELLINEVRVQGIISSLNQSPTKPSDSVLIVDLCKNDDEPQTGTDLNEWADGASVPTVPEGSSRTTAAAEPDNNEIICTCRPGTDPVLH